jgi:hypothetical protein
MKEVTRGYVSNEATDTDWGPMSQQVWHGKDASLLKDPEHRAKAQILQ